MNEMTPTQTAAAAPVKLELVYHLKEILENNNITWYRLSKVSGMSDNTIKALCEAQLDRLNVSNLERLVNALRELTGKEINVADVFTVRQTSAEPTAAPRVVPAAPVAAAPKAPRAKAAPKATPAPEPTPAPVEVAPEPTPAPVAEPAAEPEPETAAGELPRALWNAARFGLGNSIRQVGVKAARNHAAVIRATDEEAWKGLPDAEQRAQIKQAAQYFK